MAEYSNDYLSIWQLGVTVVSLTLGWLGEPAISRLFHPFLEPFGIDPAVISVISVAVSFTIVTTCQIVLSELIPKIFAMVNIEIKACKTSGVLIVFTKIPRRLCSFLTRSPTTPLN